jgi:glycosyltransferase involved in cell wall biosynthesis
MKIVLCYKYCTLGGCEAVISTRMHELQSLGVDAHAIFLKGGNGERLFSDLGDHVSICRQPAELRSKISALMPDFLISLDTPQIIDFVDIQSSNVRFIYEAHSTYPHSLKRLKSLSRCEISAIFTPSHAQRELVLSLMGKRLRCPVEVAPNPLHPNFSLSEAVQKYHRPILLWIGRLDPHKNWRAYIDICRNLQSSGTDMEYWLVGDSQTSPFEKLRLWKQVKKADLAGRFRWLPYVQYEEMHRLLRFVGASGGCLVSTSRQESFGMAAAEAMACSCPVVAPDVGGFRDFVIDNVTGFRYPPKEYHEAVKYILQFVQDTSARSRIVNAAFQRVHEEYSTRQAVIKFVELLQKLSIDCPKGGPNGDSPIFVDTKIGTVPRGITESRFSHVSIK